MSDPVFVKNQDFIWSEVGGEAVLLNVESGDYFGLNDVGLSFWEKIDGQTPLSKIISLMLDEYEVEEPVLLQDLDELSAQMLSKGLLTNRPECPAIPPALTAPGRN